MAVIARDIFSGDADADIDGRTPDGGLDVATAIGTWDYVALIPNANPLVVFSQAACCIEIAPTIGARATLGNAQKHSHYRLTGLTLPSDNYTVRASATFTGSSVDQAAELLLNHQGDPAAGVLSDICYACLFYSDGVQFYSVYNDNVSNLNYNFLAGAQGDFSLGPKTCEFTRAGMQLYASVDGAVVGFYTLDPVSDSIITGGTPGLSIISSTAVVQDVAVTLFEVDVDTGGGTSPVTPTPCQSATAQAIYSLDTFQAAVDLSPNGLETRIPDGGEIECLQLGRWHDVVMKFRTSPEGYVVIARTFGEQFSQLRQNNPTSGEMWNHESVEGIPGLGNDYSVEVEGYFTEDSTVHYSWMSCLARQQRTTAGIGQTDTFNSAGTTSYLVPPGVTAINVKCWQGGASGGAATGNPAAGGGGAGGTYVESTIPVTPGETLTIIVAAGRTAAGGAGQAGNFSAVRRGATDLVRADGAQGGALASVNSTNGAGGAANTTGSVGTTIIAGTPGSTGNFTPGAAGGQGGAAGGVGGGAGGGAPGDSSNGPSGSAPGGGGSGGKANSTIDRAGGASGAGRIVLALFETPGLEVGEHATESGYEFLYDNEGNVIFMYYVNGLYTHVAFGLIQPPVNGQSYRIRLCCVGNRFCCYIDDVLQITYEDSQFPTGDPGLCIMDSSDGVNAMEVLRVTQWKVVSDEVNAPLCGPGDGGGHGNPGGGTETPTFLWPMGKGAWRPVPNPEDTATSRVRPYGKGAPRGSRPTGIYSKGAWRSLLPPGGGFTPGGPDDPGTTDPGDTFFDPGCGTTEENPPVPPVLGPPIPLTDRFFGISNFIPPDAGELFNGFKTSIGGWTPRDLAFLESRSSVFVGAQGGYGKFLLNGRFDRSHFVDVTLGMILPLLSTLQSYTDSGTFFAYSMIDDFDSHTLWPPSGVSDADMLWMLAALRAAAPGIRFGLRGRPTQFASNLGFDFYGCQYVNWKHGDPFDFAVREYSLAASRGSFITLDLNYIAGGNCSSGLRWFSNPKWCVCSPSEVVTYLTEMFEGARSVDGAAHLAGSLGYQWDTRIFSINGMVDALITARNALAALPPLP